MCHTLSDTIESLYIAQEISVLDAYGIHELAGDYIRQHERGGGVSPSDFQDLLIREFSISDYLIATIVLDGEIGNVEYEENDEGDEEQILSNLRSIDAIIWGKHQQHKTLAVTAYLRASAPAA